MFQPLLECLRFLSETVNIDDVLFRVFSLCGVTLSNLLHIFFDSCSANTKKYQCNHHKNKCTHIKAHFFLAPQHMQFTKHYFDLSQKICTGMGAEDQTICQR